MLQKVLSQFGLKNSEIDTYTTLLKIGSQPASIIAKKLNKPRTTTTVYLTKLKQEGFIKVIWKGRTQYYVPENPKKILQNLQENKIRSMEKMDMGVRAFSTIIPELSAMMRNDYIVPKVTFYEGTNELKQMYKDTLTSKTDIQCFSSVTDLWDLFGKEYDSWYVKKRAKNQIPLMYLAKDTPTERSETKKDKKLFRQSKLLPPELFDITNEINIYDNKVSFITLKEEKIGVLIESKEIYHTMKTIFQMLWRK